MQRTFVYKLDRAKPAGYVPPVCVRCHGPHLVSECQIPADWRREDFRQDSKGTDDCSCAEERSQAASVR